MKVNASGDVTAGGVIPHEEDNQDAPFACVVERLVPSDVI